jgi:cytochrome c oxidase cbb3-type subunit 1
LTFHQRTERPLFVSQWFLLAALFWFPWIYSTAQLFLVGHPARGVAQAIIAWWFAHNLQTVYLWLSGLAIVFYFIPKITGNALHSRYLALLTFWVVILFSSWGGISQSAPVPAWMPALSTAMTVLNLVPLAAVGLSACRTTRIVAAPRPSSLPLRFVLFGVVAFVVAGLMQVVGALPGICEVTDLTWFGAARSQLNLFGFFAMAALGAIYFIVPRLVGCDCPASKPARAHFWLAACGITLVVVPEALAGVIEGLKLQHTNLGFVEIMKGTLHFLRLSTLGLLLIALGQALFLGNVAVPAVRFYRSRATATYAAVTADLFKTAGVKP